MIDISANGFLSYRKTGLVVDMGSAIQLDVVLQLATRSDTVNVMEDATRVETSDTQVGQAITSKQITHVPR